MIELARARQSTADRLASHPTEDIGTCATSFERTIHDERDLIAKLKAGRFYAVDLRSNAVLR